MITNVSDACARLFQQYGVESRHTEGTGLLEPLQNGQPYTPPNAAEIATAVTAWKPLSISASAACSYATGCTVTVRSAADVQSVTLLVRDQVVSVPCTNGVGSVTIAPLQAPTLPPHIVVRAQDQAVFGYAQTVIIAE